LIRWSKGDFEKILLKKEEAFNFFLSQKEKSCKKEVTLTQASEYKHCRLIAVSSVLQSPLVSVLSRLRESGKPAPRRRAICLTKGNSPLDGFLKSYDRMEAFLLHTDGTDAPPEADFIPTECGEITVGVFYQSFLGAK
jgi:hypothetical protein